MSPSLDLDRVLRSTGVAAFATDCACRIVACNDAATAALGLTLTEIMSRPCYDIVDGHDLDGVRFCVRGCPVRRAASAGRPIDNLTLRVRRGSRGSGLAELSSMVLSNGDGRILVHMLRFAGTGATSDLGGGRRPAEGLHLTRRETEVLARIAAGAGVKQLAPELSMSATTARTHVRSILRKLGVHRQIDAVLAAQRRGLL
jgi:DNA-binding CsgD family transcriptional regulator